MSFDHHNFYTYVIFDVHVGKPHSLAHRTYYNNSC